jgi:hypothetical protein
VQLFFILSGIGPLLLNNLTPVAALFIAVIAIQSKSFTGIGLTELGPSTEEVIEESDSNANVMKRIASVKRILTFTKEEWIEVVGVRDDLQILASLECIGSHFGDSLGQ